MTSSPGDTPAVQGWVALALGLGCAVVSVLVWRGTWRSWVGGPTGSAPLFVFPAGALLAVDYAAIVALPEGRTGSTIAAPLLLAAILVIVLGLWGPSWFGPRWYRERHARGTAGPGRSAVTRRHAAPEHRPAGTIAGVSDERGTTAGTTGTAGTTAGTTDEVPARPETFRAVPMPALIAVGFVAICISPIAFLGGPWFLVFLLPLALGWWVVRTRTTVDVEALRVRSAWGSQRLAWDDLATLRVVERGWVRAVRGDESELALVGVRTRDLGHVAQASGGRITMPTPEEVEDAAAHQRELEATRMRIARLREAEQDPEPEPEQVTDQRTPDEGPGRA